jgi:uncharacterized protein (TIGR00369 family)
LSQSAPAHDPRIPAEFTAMRAHNDGAPMFIDINGPIHLVWPNPAGEVRFGFLAERRHANPNGVVHGGMLFGVVDNMMGFLVFRALQEKGVARPNIATVSMNIEFLGAARIGDWVEGKAYLTKLGRQLAFLRAEMFVADKPALNASSSYAIIERPSAG